MPPKKQADETGIGILPNGELNVVDPDSPRFEPTVIDDDGDDDLIDASTLEEMSEAFEGAETPDE